ncbi:meiotic nuclear divisions 1 [Phlyctochytrium arcticum]|nr:meiotic nuclear divisions 1 [Phlyctochytrium arcticum]
MSKRKALSFEEKRTRLADFFYETKDFWQLKDIEKIASKSKGIVTQSIKEVLESLVSDNLVTVEKIGTSNYYWSFPSTAVQTRKRKIDDLEEELDKLKSKKRDIEAQIQEDLAGREQTDDRNELLERWETAKQLKTSQEETLAKYRDSDPSLIEAKRKAIKVAKDAANRWTDNIFALQSYCSKTFNVPSQQLFEQFGIPEDFDTIS